MDVGEISSDAAKYPLSDFKKVIILGMMFITSVLIIPAFLALGYLLRIIKASIAGSNELPELDELGNMFVDGLKLFTVLLIYSLIPGAMIIAGIWVSLGSLVALQSSSSAISAAAIFGLIGGLTFIGGALAILISFILAIAIGNMAYYEQLKASFRFTQIIQKIGEIGWVDYIIWYVVMIFIEFIVLLYITFFLIFSLFIGLVIVPLIVAPYIAIFTSRSVSLIYTSRKTDYPI